MSLKTPYIFILCSSETYENALRNGIYVPPNFDTEGFIHASKAEQLTRVANKYYREMARLLLLCIDTRKVHPEIKWEPISTGDLYPHIYGPLNLDAIVTIQSTQPDSTGNYEINPQSLMIKPNP